MSNELQSAFKTYSFGGQNVRSFLRSDSVPCLMAIDVCDVLHTRTDHLKDILESDEYGEIPNPHSMGVAQNGGKTPLYITEAGFYSLVLRSRKPIAKPFRRWVTHEVLPDIRRTGVYVNKKNPQSSLAFAQTLLGDPDFAIRVFQEIKTLKQNIAEANKQLEAQRPDVEFAREISATKGGIGVGQMAALLTKKGETITQNKLFQQLRERGFLNAQHGRNRNLPTKAGQATGWFTTVAQHYWANGERNECLRTLITPLGQKQLLAEVPQPALIEA